MGRKEDEDGMEEEARRREENRQHKMNLFSMLVHTLRAPNRQWQVPQRGQHSDFSGRQYILQHII